MITIVCLCTHIHLARIDCGEGVDYSSSEPGASFQVINGGDLGPRNDQNCDDLGPSDDQGGNDPGFSNDQGGTNTRPNCVVISGSDLGPSDNQTSIGTPVITKL